jgi:hypothetical protein
MAGQLKAAVRRRFRRAPTYPNVDGFLREMHRSFGIAFQMGLLAGLALAVVACTPAVAVLPPLPSDTPPPPTLTPTATIIWFPPTATFTPFPTPAAVYTPTPTQALAHGELIFVDDFSSVSLWTLARTSTGTTAITQNELTVAVSQPDGYLYSLRQGPALADFFAEVTASPSLCRDRDEYGLLLRFTSPAAFYRFSLSCKGEARLDRYLGGRASSPQPWTASGAIPPGAPSSSRLAVLLEGKKMQFYVNGEFLFTVNEPSIPSGSLGVFARSTGDTPVTVNFSDLKVYKPAP